MTDHMTTDPATTSTAVVAPLAAGFEMQIQDVFRLTDRTALVGHVTAGAKVDLRGLRCDLVIDDQVVQGLTLEGLMIPRITDPARLKAPRPTSVSTRDSVPLDPATVRARACRLVEHDAHATA